MHSCNGPSEQAVVYGPFGVIYCGPSSQKIASANSIANYMAAHSGRKKHGRYDGALSTTRNVSIRQMCSLFVLAHMRAVSPEFCVWRLRLEGRNWLRRYLTCWRRRRRVIYKGRRLRRLESGRVDTFGQARPLPRPTRCKTNNGIEIYSLTRCRVWTS